MNLIILVRRLLSIFFLSLSAQTVRATSILLLTAITNLPVFSQRICVDAPPVVNAGVLSETESAAALPDLIIIPVVVHVIYHEASQNISAEQIRSQIAVLNNDFRRKNNDASFVPDAFKELAADARIEFRLATVDPSGAATNGITRKYTSVSAFAATNDDIKRSSAGGEDAWDRNKYLNIWVGNLVAGIMGYASNPSSAPEKDGVVISHSVFGTTPNVAAPFNKGRTTVHEVGHWLGLRHIWGDSDCGDDRIEDTPPQQGPTRGCPNGVVSSCTNGAAGSMYMNFMDFTNDECTNMFTHGQAAKMRELFVKGNARHPLLSSQAAAGAVNNDSEVNDNLVVGMRIYPNPARRNIIIELPSASVDGRRITVYNQLGQIAGQYVASNSRMSVDISKFKSGVYYVSTGQGKTMKFVKAH